MPTGYTHKLCEADQEFDDFVWTCARAMGALIMMRDDSSDAPIDLDNPGETGTYNTESLAKAREDYAELSSMPTKSLHERMAIERAETIAQYEKLIEECRIRNSRLKAMRRKILDWNPPTFDHETFRDFMSDQLTISLDDDLYYREALDKLRASSLEQMAADRLSSLTRDIHYHQEELANKTRRNAERVAWLKALDKSVPIPAHRRKV